MHSLVLADGTRESEISTASTPIIVTREIEPDFEVHIKDADYVVSDAIINPVTKENIRTYILKENTNVSFSFLNVNVDLVSVIISNFYYRTIKNKTFKIRCFDQIYYNDTDIEILPERTYKILSVTRKLPSCLFITELHYKENQKNEKIDKIAQIAFKIVTEKEFTMYDQLARVINKNKIKEKNDNGTIKRPKKVD